MHAHSMTNNSPVDRIRRRKREPGVRLPLNDNNPADGICPACHAPAPVAPIASDHVGRGRVHEHWLCDYCGFEWTTTVHVVS